MNNEQITSAGDDFALVKRLYESYLPNVIRSLRKAQEIPMWVPECLDNTLFEMLLSAEFNIKASEQEIAQFLVYHFRTLERRRILEPKVIEHFINLFINLSTSDQPIELDKDLIMEMIKLNDEVKLFFLLKGIKNREAAKTTQDEQERIKRFFTDPAMENIWREFKNVMDNREVEEEYIKNFASTVLRGIHYERLSSESPSASKLHKTYIKKGLSALKKLEKYVAPVADTSNYVNEICVDTHQSYFNHNPLRKKIIREVGERELTITFNAVRKIRSLFSEMDKNPDLIPATPAGIEGYEQQLSNLKITSKGPARIRVIVMLLIAFFEKHLNVVQGKWPKNLDCFIYDLVMIVFKEETDPRNAPDFSMDTIVDMRKNNRKSREKKRKMLLVLSK